MTVRIITAHVLDGLRQMEAESVHCVVTSPPYYGLRDYGIAPQVWGGDPGCEHDFKMEQVVAGDPRGNGNWQDGLPSGNGHHSSRFAGDMSAAQAKTPAAIVERGCCRHCSAWRGSLGLEPTLDLYLDHMVEIFREIRRVLRKDGTCWLNIGDSYASGGGTGKQGSRGQRFDRTHTQEYLGVNRAQRECGMKPKDLMLIPSRLAIRLCDDGWWVRSDIAWCKKAPMPESCTDRPTTAWEHVFLLTKSAAPTYWTHRDHEGSRTKPAPDYRWQQTDDHGKVVTEQDFEPPGFRKDWPHWKRINLWDGHDYFYDQEAVKEASESEAGSKAGYAGYSARAAAMGRTASGNEKPGMIALNNGNRNLRNFWLLGPSPFAEAHFATFPPRIPEICIKAGTSERGVCPKCGAGWERIIKDTREYATFKAAERERKGGGMRSNDLETLGLSRGTANKSISAQSETIGWRPTCSCDAGKGKCFFPDCGAGIKGDCLGCQRGVSDPVPATVLDPFLGAGTTALVADRLGRHCIGIELSPQYARMAENRVRSDAGMFAEIAAE